MNLNKLRRASSKLSRPTSYVPCPELKDWLFSEGEKPQLRVRGLNANEQLLCREETARQQKVRQEIGGITPASANGVAVKEALLAVIGAQQGELAQSLPYLVQLILFGVIDEEGKRLFSYQDAAILHEHFPATFLTLTNKIAELMGEPSGPALGESLGVSGQTPRSEIPSPSLSTSENPSMKSEETSSPMTDLPQ